MWSAAMTRFIWDVGYGIEASGVRELVLGRNLFLLLRWVGVGDGEKILFSVANRV